MREGIYVFVRGAVRTRGELFVARCACVYLFFGVQRGGREGCLLEATVVGFYELGRSRGRERGKQKKKGNGLLDLVLVVGTP